MLWAFWFVVFFFAFIGFVGVVAALVEEFRADRVKRRADDERRAELLSMF